MTYQLSETALYLLIATYLIGAIPFGLVFAKILTGKDPRQHGSGNIGATNAMRTGGKKVGILTLIADVFKGVIPVAIALQLDFSSFETALIALAAFIGHIFPVYLKFKGGKGVATMFGVVLPWMPWVALISFAIWFVSFKLTRYVSLSSILAGLALPVLAFGFNADMPAILTCVVLGLLMTIRHHENIKRLQQGTESKS